MTRIEILGVPVEVKIDGSRLAQEEALGIYEEALGHILIQDHLDSRVQGEALVHEVLECINHKLELRFAHRAISALATGVYGFIVQNPDTINRLMLQMAVVEPGENGA